MPHPLSGILQRPATTSVARPPYTRRDLLRQLPTSPTKRSGI